MPRYREFWYNTWRCMMSRCYNPKNVSYPYYGGRGIKVCDEWHNPDEFGKWANKSGWFDGATIDRINTDDDYSPSNCQWASRKQQAHNRRSTVFVDIEGESKSLTEWAKETKICRSTIINRYEKGYRGKDLIKPVEASYKGWTWKVKEGKRRWQKDM